MIAPKRAPVTPAESRKAYEQAAQRAFGLCEICGKARATETHHRLHRSHGGRDEVANLLRVCGWGNHTGCHGAAHSHTDRYVNGWAVRTGDNPSTRPVLYRGALMVLTADGGLS